MIVPIAIVIGVLGSLAIHNWLPLVAGLVIAVIFHELMLYDIHRHLLNLEDQIDG